MTYGRGLDTTRMRTVLGFEPRYTTEQAVTEFATARSRARWATTPWCVMESLLSGALEGKHG